jgi:hypothetical protein
MLRDYESEVQHWRRVTKFSRVIGVWFILGGSFFAVWGIHLALHLGVPFAGNGVEDHHLQPRLTMAAMGTLLALLGVGLVSARAYRPDLGDRNALDRFVDPFDTFSERKAQPYRGARSWWTGDPTKL